jgi:hypothetical protein
LSYACDFIPKRRVFSFALTLSHWHKFAEKEIEIIVHKPLEVTVEKVIEKEGVDKVDVKEPRCEISYTGSGARIRIRKEVLLNDAYCVANVKNAVVEAGEHNHNFFFL